MGNSQSEMNTPLKWFPPGRGRLGLAWGVAGLVFFVLSVLASPLYPVKISGSGRYLVDQNNVPFLMVGDSPQSLIVNLSATNAAFYFTDRATNGFNSVWVDLLCATYTRGPTNGSLLNGTLPFTNTIATTSSYDLTTPNEAYFAYVDQIINLAATNRIEVMLDPIETGGWLNTMLANGTNNCRAYGQYLGNRYKNFPNIIWCSGNDFQNWSNPANDAVVTAVALGIKDQDTNHLQTVQLNYLSSSSLDDPNWAPIIGLNAAYTYAPTYAEVLHAYNQSSAIPTFMIEAGYEYETNSGTDGGSTRNLRMQEYWTMLSGATGQLYGNHYTWQFASGWQNYLDSPGVVQLGYMANLFGSRAWTKLVPDQTQAFVTRGYGSFVTNGLFTGNNYVTSALTPDGSLGMAYLPQGGTITVAMTNLQNTITARWFDPSANTFTTVAGSPFSNAGTQNFTSPGNNSAGNPDWMLVLEVIKKPPTLSISVTPTNTAVVAWPGYVLQQSPNLTTTSWVNATNAIAVVSDEYQVVISPLAGQEFFRLESVADTPSLQIFQAAAHATVVAWPGYVLQQNSNLMTTNWVNSTNPILVVGDEYRVVISPIVGQQFYRLMNP